MGFIYNASEKRSSRPALETDAEEILDPNSAMWSECNPGAKERYKGCSSIGELCRYLNAHSVLHSGAFFAIVAFSSGHDCDAGYVSGNIMEVRVAYDGRQLE